MDSSNSRDSDLLTSLKHRVCVPFRFNSEMSKLNDISFSSRRHNLYLVCLTALQVSFVYDESYMSGKELERSYDISKQWILCDPDYDQMVTNDFVLTRVLR